MAHESFEDANVASLLNEFFIPIKVDREERPDVDALYMAATQLLSGHGGWPMSVFLTPDGRAFMAGTYYPPVDRQGQVGFARLLTAMHDAWVNQRDAVEQQARELQEGIGREVSFIDHLAPYTESLDLATIRQQLRDELVSRVDDDGGFGDAPKFPRPSYVEALIDYDDPESRSALARTLNAMSRRGLYDHLRGGFARYSVDGSWHVPHFEKMLSDQALLARAYGRAASVVGQREWRDVADDTINFVRADLSLRDGFASSLDADAGGVEGSHVTWTPHEVRAALLTEGLGDDVSAALARWRITDPGQFEGRSIPRLADSEPFMTPSALEGARESLRRSRATRPQPLRDEKVILEWNAMFASALLRSGQATYEAEGVALLRTLARTHFAENSWWRTEDQNAYAGASDVAWLLDASLDAYELGGNDEWIDSATMFAHYILSHFWDGDVPTSTWPNIGSGLFAQSDQVTDLRLRTKEIFDGATPSSHAVSCRALARLALCTGDAALLVVAQRLVALAAPLIAQHPGAVPDLVDAAGYALAGVEVVVPGDANVLSDHVRSMAMPRTVLITGHGSSPLLEGRRAGLAYVCRGGVCQLPVDSIEALGAQLRLAVA